MNFTFATAAQIIFGPGSVAQIGTLAANMGERVLLVTGSGRTHPQRVVRLLQEAGIEVTVFAVEQEPDIALVQRATEAAREAGCDSVVGFGGGSVLDTAKAVSALLTNPGAVLDYLEVVGKGRPLSHQAAPCIAIPTTAGTGTEVTKNAVIQVAESRVKVSLRSPLMIPQVALVDPELTVSMPPEVTASTGMDALTQVLEPFVSPAANAMTDLFCAEGLRRAQVSLRKAFYEGENMAARIDMAWVSLLGGLALANGKLGAVHGFAGPLGGMYAAPHGAVCARLLPGVVRINIRALLARDAANPALERYGEISKILTGDAQADLGAAVAWLTQTVDAFAIPGLGAYGLTTADLPLLVENARHSSSMKGNPIALTDAEMLQILDEAL